MRTRSILWSALGMFCCNGASAAEPAFKAIVEAEEEVYRYEEFDNGAGPSWCAGCTCIVRSGGAVLVSGMEKIPEARPLNNARWLLFARTAEGWRLQQKDPAGRTREPSPLGVLSDGSVLMSVNPTLAPPDAHAGPARPQILRFDARRPEQPFRTILPVWDGQPAFTEHSYRSFAVDGPLGEYILFQNIGYTHAEWAFCDRDGRWSRNGRLAWPWGADYAKPQPIRVCYPSVQLRERAVFFCGVSDIVEPNPAWREYKERLTGRQWDYDFRRLFFTWTPDVVAKDFRPWVEVASREKTCGWLFPCDLWADPGGVAHVLWTERAIDTRLREQFFPDEKQSEALNYARIREGRVISQSSILLAREGDESSPVPGRGRFQVTPAGRLFVFLHAVVRDADNKRTDRNFLVEIRPDGTTGPFVPVPLKVPLTNFFTAGVRAGCAPSETIDLLGDSNRTVRYARVRLAY
ncbi:MAG: hypothetical protein AMXMBFR83_15260 [Phycisphaerae bacterium]